MAGLYDRRFKETLRPAQGLKGALRPKVLPTRTTCVQPKESTMNKSTYPQSRPLGVTIFAAVSAFVAVGLLSAVAVSFQSSGAPFEKVVAAESACKQYVYVSDRETCMNAWLASMRDGK